MDQQTSYNNLFAPLPETIIDPVLMVEHTHRAHQCTSTNQNNFRSKERERAEMTTETYKERERSRESAEIATDISELEL